MDAFLEPMERRPLIGIHGPAGSGKGTCARALPTWNQVDFADALRREVASALESAEVDDWPEQGASSALVSEKIPEAVWVDKWKPCRVYLGGDSLVMAAARTAARHGGDAGYRFASWLRDGLVDSDGACERTLRQVLQFYGTEVGRAANPDYWVDEWSRADAACRLSRRCWRYDRRTGKCGEDDSMVGGVVVTDVRFPNEARRIRGLGGRVVRLDAPWASTKAGIPGHASDARLPDDLVDLVVEVAPLAGDYESWAGRLAADFLGALT